ncbi:MAG: Nif11-like leader peptide family natural product precursor [Phycisphaerae bacterium]
MSSADAVAFLKRLDQDETFRGQVESARTADQFWALVARSGYEFTREEFLAAERFGLEPVEELLAPCSLVPDIADPDEIW